ncbi:MAG TPA: hypothetical protein VGD99_05030 [Anaerolineae bacterium]
MKSATFSGFSGSVGHGFETVTHPDRISIRPWALDGNGLHPDPGAAA